EPRSMSIVHGVIDDSDITARILFPTREKEPFLPFERFAESVATSRKKGDLHAHLGQEVVTYVLEGTVDHEYGAGVHDNLTPASSSPISRSRSEGPPFSDLATTAAAWCTSSTGLGPSTTTSWNWVTGLSWRTCPRSRSRARPGTGSPWRRCLDPDRSRPPAVL